jgi:hypothetical protein
VKTTYETVHLRLDVIRSFITTRQGACIVCGLPGHLNGLMSVPGVAGHFCCLECVECRLFGPGRCRWCGFTLDLEHSAFCCDNCRELNESSPFGSGKRFALWLNRHNPPLFAKLVGQEIPTGITCLNCADILDGKRKDSLFCSANCQKRFNRAHHNSAVVKREDYPGHKDIACVIAGTANGEGVQTLAF